MPLSPKVICYIESYIVCREWELFGGTKEASRAASTFPRAGRDNGGVFARVRLPFVPDRAGVQNDGWADVRCWAMT